MPSTVAGSNAAAASEGRARERGRPFPTVACPTPPALWPSGLPGFTRHPPTPYVLGRV